MIKRFRWVILATLAGGAILWLVAVGVGKKGNNGAGDPKGEVGRSRQQGDLVDADPAGRNDRESSRHSTGEVEKQRATPLKQRVAQLELQVEDKRKELMELAKARGISKSGLVGESPDKADTPEEVAKQARNVKDFEDKRGEYVMAKELLKKLRVELALEQAKAKPEPVSR